MTNAVQIIPAGEGAPEPSPVVTSNSGAGTAASESPTLNASDRWPESWSELRENSDIQFEEVALAPPPPPPEPSEPGWFDESLRAFFSGLGEILAPIGQLLGISWPVLSWILLGLLALFVLYLAFRIIGPIARNPKAEKNAESVPEWQPDEEESIALLDDADKLAAEGRYDEATHLLLQRSVGQIAEARPEWVEPSSTARELAALPNLSDAARSAFATISERVERSLFALRSLNKSDWEAARSAYANFALARIEGPAKQDIDSALPTGQVRAV